MKLCPTVLLLPEDPLVLLAVQWEVGSVTKQRALPCTVLAGQMLRFEMANLGHKVVSFS
jgi:hypothetical protein